MFPSFDNMGSPVTDYQLFRNQGSDDTIWTPIAGYSFIQDGYIATIDTALEGMTAGKLYSFAYLSHNLKGDS